MTMAERTDPIHVQTKGVDFNHAISDGDMDFRRDSRGVDADGGQEGRPGGDAAVADLVDKSKTGYFAYFHTREFYIVLVLGLAVHSFKNPFPPFIFQCKRLVANLREK